MSDQINKYKSKVEKRLAQLNEVFVNASVGNFSKDVPVVTEDDEFASVFIGIQVMLEVVREKLSESKNETNRLKILINSLPVGVYIADVPSGKPLIVNDKAEELIGRKFNPDTGLEKYSTEYKVVDLNSKQYPESEHPIFIAIKTGKSASKRDIVIQRRKDDRVVLKVVAKPVFDGDGKMISVVAVLDDITKEHELENLKSGFLSSASHQLRTPLGIMRWNLELILKDYSDVDPEVLEFVQEAYTANKRMVKLVDSLVDVSKLETNKIEVNKQKTDLIRIIDLAIKDLSAEAKDRSVDVTFGKEDKLFIKTDPDLLREALNNVLYNSILYNKKNGKVEVKIIENKNSYQINIIDTGIGIKSSDMKNIFKRFYRTAEAVNIFSDGSGLGLYIAKSYIELLQGELEIESEFNKGTTVAITIPKV